MIDPATITVILTSGLICERIFKYFVQHTKRSKCCMAEVEFHSANSIKKIHHEEIQPDEPELKSPSLNNLTMV